MGYAMSLLLFDLPIQVPLGTVVHKLKPTVEVDEFAEPFRFQQHWVGARDYVSSEDEEEQEGMQAAAETETMAELPARLSPTSPPNSEVIHTSPAFMCRHSVPKPINYSLRCYSHCTGVVCKQASGSGGAAIVKVASGITPLQINICSA